MDQNTAGDAGNGHVGVLTTTTQAEGANDGGSSKRKLSADCVSREGEDRGEMPEGPGARDCRAEQGNGPRGGGTETQTVSVPGSGSPSSNERGADHGDDHQTGRRGDAPDDDSSDNSGGKTEHLSGVVSLNGKNGRDANNAKNAKSGDGGPHNDIKADSVDRNSSIASSTGPLLTDNSNKEVGGPNGHARASSSVHYSIIDAVGLGASGSTFMDEGILTSADSGDPHSLYGSFTWKVPKFHEVSKRELKSSSFSVGPYKWYILVYPNGCDVSNHLSLFLCVADYDKLLPGWSHFAQFTIAVVNKDPKKSKYSDTLHRFCKKEHDWGWKKFMELGKMQDGFVVSDTLVIKVQVQVIKDRLTAPFRTLDCHYRRELIRVYLSNIEGIVRRFIDKTKEKVRGLLKDDAMGEFWGSISQKEKLKLSSTPAAPLLKNFTKVFFNEKEVTSTLMMDAAFCAMKLMDCRHKFLIEGKKVPDAEEDSDKDDVNPLERYVRSINESWHSLHLDGTKGVFKFEKMDFVSPIAALSMFIEPIWMGNLRYIEVNDTSKKGGKASGAGGSGDGSSAGSGASGMPTSTKGLVDLNLTMFTEEKCFTLPGEMDELKLVTAARLALEAFAMEHIAEQIESARKEAEIIRMQEELIREEEEAHKDQAAKKAKQAEAEREKKARKREKQRAKQEAERAKQEAEAERKAREEEQKRREKELKRQEIEEKRRKEEAAMEAERQKLLLERERKMKLEMEKREKERLEKQQRLLLEKAERERAEKLEKERGRQLQQQREQQEQREQDVRSNHSNYSDISRQDSLDGSIATLSDQSGPLKSPSMPTSPVKAGASVAAAATASAAGAGGDVSGAKALSAMRLLLQSRDEEIERLKQKVSSLEADLEKALTRLSTVSATGQKKLATSPSQNIANMSQQHLASHAYLLQQMAMNPTESILGVSGVSSVSALNQSTGPRTTGSQQTPVYNASYPMYAGNTPQDGPVRQTGASVTAAPGVSPTDVSAIGVSNAVEAGAPAATDDFDSAFAHLGLVESLLD